MNPADAGRMCLANNEEPLILGGGGTESSQASGDDRWRFWEDDLDYSKGFTTNLKEKKDGETNFYVSNPNLESMTHFQDTAYQKLPSTLPGAERIIFKL